LASLPIHSGPSSDGASSPAPAITQEQRAIVESRSTFLKVNAFAGSGKTTTLGAYARARPARRMLYLAFNKSIQLEASRKFPSNVKPVTSHALAFPKFGSRYSNSGKLTDRLRVNQVVDALGLKEYPEHFKLYVSDVCLKVLNRYIASDAAEIGIRHAEGLIIPESGILASDIVSFTKKLWDRMCDPTDAGVGMVHDGYLKLYQISNPRLPFDTILFDEAQDANPVTAKIVESQDCEKVIVGDGHQSLYGFRGATNAMHRFAATETLYLTRSFRFGQQIADVANYVLSTFKGERRTIQGTSRTAQIGFFHPGYQHTVIARTNATLFEEAAAALAAKRNIHFVGGIAGYRIQDIMDAYHLWAKNVDRIENPYLRSFGEFDRMCDYAIAVDDKELKSLIHVVRKHSSKIPRMVERIRSGATEEPAIAHVMLTTAHKAKGLEWDKVRLADDFVKLVDDYGQPRKIDASEEEEINIVYVAATRAKTHLQPFPELQTLYDQHRLSSRSAKMPDWARPVIRA
jgi:F-box protein 18 (helicase)